MLCDFDLTKQTAAQAGINIFNAISIVDDGGKIMRRRDAYYMAADGSRMATAFVSDSAVRYVMEFDSVQPSSTTVSLVNGSDRIQSVPVAAAQAAPDQSQAQQGQPGPSQQ